MVTVLDEFKKVKNVVNIPYEILRVVNQSTQSSMIVIILPASISSDRLSGESSLYPEIADNRRSKSKAISPNVAVVKRERGVSGACNAHPQLEQRGMVLAPLSFSL